LAAREGFAAVGHVSDGIVVVAKLLDHGFVRLGHQTVGQAQGFGIVAVVVEQGAVACG